jgi:hypothetical protein
MWWLLFCADMLPMGNAQVHLSARETSNRLILTYCITVETENDQDRRGFVEIIP